MRRFRIYSNQTSYYFSTCTVVQWQCVFKEDKYFQIIIDSLKYCMGHKGLILIGYVIMLNHLHLLTSNEEGASLSNIMRDFKRFTARRISEELEKDNERLLLYVFKKAAEGRKKKQNYKIWQDEFHPEAIYSEEWFTQKLDYIHYNPVKKGFVTRPEDWKYSSARNWSMDDNSIIPIDKDRLCI